MFAKLTTLSILALLTSTRYVEVKPLPEDHEVVHKHQQQTGDIKGDATPGCENPDLAPIITFPKADFLMTVTHYESSTTLARDQLKPTIYNRYNISRYHELVTKVTWVVSDEGETELQMCYLKNFKESPSYQISNAIALRKRQPCTSQSTKYESNYGSFERDIENRILLVSTMKYSGQLGVSPLDGKEYFIFNDQSTSTFKHFVDKENRWLSHSIMDFCYDTTSTVLCNNGKSDRYEVREYTYDFTTPIEPKD